MRIVITGASDGIGLEAASQLAAQGHDLVMVGRSPEKTAAAADRVRRESPGVGVETELADYTSLAQVRALGERLAAGPPVDVLVNNAGTVFAQRTITADGHEATWQVNHLGPFVLTEVLRPHLAPGGRIVTTASTGHYRGTLDFDDLGFERGYTIMRAYSRSKLANVLHTRWLAGEGLTANCLHPGAIATSIWSGAPAYARPVLSLLKRVAMERPAVGGGRLTHLATAPVGSGEYYEKNRPKRPANLALDDSVMARLIEVSREQTA